MCSPPLDVSWTGSDATPRPGSERRRAARENATNTVAEPVEATQRTRETSLRQAQGPHGRHHERRLANATNTVAGPVEAIQGRVRNVPSTSSGTVRPPPRAV